MLRIRLIRTGKINRPSYRLAVLPRRSSPKSGKFLELLGNYDPIKKDRSFKKERVEYWISKGAVPSDTAKNILISSGILEGKKVPVHKMADASGGESADKLKAEEENKEGEGESQVAEAQNPEESAPEEKSDSDESTTKGA